MRKIFISLTAFVLLWTINSHAVAQTTQPSQTPAGTETEKSEVDKLLEAAERRGDRIFGTCLENCENFEPIEGFEAGRALVLAKPGYPLLARKAKVSGEVLVKMILDVDGTVIASSVVSGHPLLRAASVQAARDSRFAPSTYFGEPIKVVGIVKYSFVSQ